MLLASHGQHAFTCCCILHAQVALRQISPVCLPQRATPAHQRLMFLHVVHAVFSASAEMLGPGGAVREVVEILHAVPLVP
jgi:hypothetical protein